MVGQENENCCNGNGLDGNSIQAAATADKSQRQRTSRCGKEPGTWHDTCPIHAWDMNMCASCATHAHARKGTHTPHTLSGPPGASTAAISYSAMATISTQPVQGGIHVKM
eukprot:355847-Chlamydomonas_euryale.AAC.7